ncbi:hypothetical protein ACFVT5_31590 [Streptomyces sp. NPDC058001]|uniref:hypothetical protein n=1 Tax=Streptomyces sp. NPDC058001 TaxID=3346300 RepID=UPI0036EB8F79
MRGSPPVSAFPQGRIRRAAMVSVVCAGVIAAGAGLTGCSSEDPDAGTNGVGKLAADKIQSKSRTAAESASSVRLSGTVVSKGLTYKLDMRLKGNGGTGSVTSKKGTFRLLRVGEHLFLKADSGFWSHEDDGKGDSSESDKAVANKLDGKYVKVPQGDPAYQQLSGFTDMKLLLEGLLTLHGKLDKGDREDSGGVRTVQVTGDKGAGGTLDVSLEGTPFPLRLVRAGDAGTISLTDWNKEFVLKEPDKTETVDYGKQLPTS